MMNQLRNKYQTKFQLLLEQKMLVNNKMDNIEDYYKRKVGENFEILNREIDEIYNHDENRYLVQNLDFKKFN